MKKRPPRKQQGRAARPGDYAVGYGRPPKSTQWKKGQTGNPKGRKKGSKSIKTIVRGLFNRRVKVRDGDGVRKIAALEAMFLRFLERAMNGDAKAAAFLLDYYEEQIATEVQDTPMPEHVRLDKAAAAEFMATKYRQMLRTVVPVIR